MSDHQAAHEHAMQQIYRTPKRVAAGILLNPHLINSYYKELGIHLTQDRVADVKALLRAMLNDPEHNPSTAREHTLLDIRHDLGFLELSDALHYNKHPDCFIAYLIDRYRHQATTQYYLLHMETHEIAALHETILAVIEERGKSGS